MDEEGIRHAPALYNGAFSTIAFLIGAATSIVSGWAGMKIATYANARTALEARKGIAPAFMTGASRFAHRRCPKGLWICYQPLPCSEGHASDAESDISHGMKC